MKLNSQLDMTHGPLLGKLLYFSLPLMASNVLQLLFNAADMAVVGRFAGFESLAAVGSTSSIVHLIINLLMGISVGVNILLARYLGQGRREEDIGAVVQTAVLLALVGGTVLGGVGVLASPAMLRLIATPENIYPLALTYLRIYFIGSPFIMLYNYGAAALRAKGDTRRPLLYLMLSGGANVAMNLLFVIVFHMDVAGVALATVLSELLSAGLILRCLLTAQDAVRLSWRELRIDRDSLVEMARIGIPAGIQSCLFSLSNVVIQGAVNAYGGVVMAGCSAGASIENFLYVSMNAFHHACQTFTSQNLGAGKRERIGKIVRTCLCCTVVLGLVQSVLLVVFSDPLVRMFNPDPAVIQAGSLRLLVVASPYVIFGIADVLVGAIRGYGFPIAPVVINLLGTCVFRLVWIHLLDTSVRGVEWVYAAFPISWAIIMVALVIFWIIIRRRDRLLPATELLADTPNPQ